jgi:large subunit ribosomal protein L13
MTEQMTTSNRTFSPRPRDIERRWYVVDADGAVLGRLASEVAKILRGKHKPIFAPHADTGDHVIVVNAKGVRLTGGKENEKIYYRHSGYPGGLREIGYAKLLAERPAVAVEKAIKGMLPKNRLGRQMITKLKVYEGADHPHVAQGPSALRLGEIPRWEGLPKPAPKLAKLEEPAKAAAPAKPARSSAKRATAKATGAKRSTAKSTAKRGASAGAKRGSRAGSEAAPERGKAEGTAAEETAGSRRRIRRKKES